MSIPLRLLILEDLQDDAFMLLRELKRAGYEVEHECFQDAESFRAHLVPDRWDIIISDYAMPSFSGLEAFHILKETGLDIPFIIVSGTIGEELAVIAMKAGVSDYVMKDKLVRVGLAVQRELRDAAERRARREAESQLRISERLRSVGELTCSLIHDLKNPLQVILSSSELLKREGTTDTDREKFTNLIEKQVQLVLNMSKEIMDFVRSDSQLSKSKNNLAYLIEELAETYAVPFEHAAVRLAFESFVEPSQAVAVIDREKIWRALLNLITNAKDAMPGGGEIRISLNADEDASVIEISDTGGGIPEQIQGSLFSPFVTHGKSHGTGLGLAIVKRIIEAHDGTVSFRTAKGQGTTFRITLPRRNQDSGLSKAHTSQESPQTGVLAG